MEARYARQNRLPGWSEAAQQRVASATVLVVGMGGLGCPASLYLARAGVRALRICDFDTVQATDLHRQVLYTDQDVGWHKAHVAATRLEQQHADLRVEPLVDPFTAAMADGADVVLDCTDEPGTRALVHQVCMEKGIPLVWAAVEGWEAQWTTVTPGNGPCLRCLWPSPADAPSCEQAGILGPVVAMAGSWQALAALRILTGNAPPPGRLHVHDLRGDEADVVQYNRRADCPACAVVPK